MQLSFEHINAGVGRGLGGGHVSPRSCRSRGGAAQPAELWFYLPSQGPESYGESSRWGRWSLQNCIMSPDDLKCFLGSSTELGLRLWFG